MVLKRFVTRFSKDELAYSLVFISFFALLIVCSTTSLASINSVSTIILKTIFVAASVFVFIWTLFKKKTNLPFLLLIFEFIYLVSNAIVLAIIDTSFITFVWSFGTVLMTILLLNIVIASRRTINSNVMFLVGFGTILFGLISCVYSNIVEASDILNSIYASGEDSHYFQIHSFFENKNAYGFILFSSLAFTAYFFFKYKHLRLLCTPVYLYLFINLIFSRCKIAIVSVLLLSIVTLALFLLEIKKKYSVIFLFAIFALVVIASCMVFIPQIYNNFAFLERVNNYIAQGFFGQAFRSFSTRLEQFDRVAPLFSNPMIIVGYGERTQLVEMDGVFISTSIDNAFASIFLTGGIFKVMLFLFALAYCEFNLIRLFRINKKEGIFAHSLLVCFLAYGVFEGYSFLGTSFYSFYWSILLFILPNVFLQENIKEKIVLHVVGSFEKGGTESFILNYLSAIRKHSEVKFDIYCFGQADIEQVKRLIDLNGKIYYGNPPSKRGLIKEMFHFLFFIGKHNNFDIIHCSANFDNFVYLHIANLLDIRLRIQHAHDTLTGVKFSFLNKSIFRVKRIINNYNSNKTFACSKEAGDDITGEPFFKSHGIVIPNSIDFNRFRDIDLKKAGNFIEEYGLHNKKIFGNISRFENKKNQRFIVSIFEEYHKKHAESILILGGTDGGNLEEIVDLVSKSTCKDAVKFIGPRNDVEVWLGIIDVYLMPSLFEGFGISAIEAQVSGAYVLASKNLPPSADVGLDRISFLSLDDSGAWLKLMNEKKRTNKLNIDTAKYNINNNYKLLLSEYDCGWK